MKTDLEAVLEAMKNGCNTLPQISKYCRMDAERTMGAVWRGIESEIINPDELEAPNDEDNRSAQ